MFLRKQLETWPAPAMQFVACSALFSRSLVCKGAQAGVSVKALGAMVEIITCLACSFGGPLSSVKVS